MHSRHPDHRRRPCRAVLRAEAGAAAGHRRWPPRRSAKAHRRPGRRAASRRRSREGDTPQKRTRATRSRPAPASSTRTSRSAWRARRRERIARSARLRRAVRQGPRRPTARQSREAAHSARRIVHVRGDRPARAIMAALVARVRTTPSIRVLEGYVAEDLIVAAWRASSASMRARLGGRRVDACRARAVVLATGGIGHLYAVTTNPAEARGARPRHGGARRRDDRRSGIRAVPSDRDRHRPRPGAARDRGAARRRRDAGQSRSGERFMQRSIPTPSSRRATSSRAACSPRSRPGAAHSSMRARRSARRFAERFPDRYADLPRGRHRSGARADPGRAGGALPHGRRRDRRARAHLARRPVGGRRSRLDRRARRQSARVELAAGGRGVRGARRRGSVGARRAAVRYCACRVPSCAAACRNRPSSRNRISRNGCAIR